MIGKTVSHYKILEKLGQGGMGVIYKAEDILLKRTVVLKFLPSDLTDELEARERFSHEAQAASALDHPNICTIFEIGKSEQNQMFIAMAYYQGETLKELISRGPVSVEKAVDITLQIAAGLGTAHDHEIVHRDIKPANIVITSDGTVKILDFGLAKLKGRTKVTKTGSTLGTVAYMSPEQIQGDVADARSDIWSVGVVLFEVLTGRLPFRGEHDAAMMYSTVNEQPEPISTHRPDLPADFISIVTKSLEKDPEDRYQSLGDMLVDLRRVKKQSTRVKEATERPVQLSDESGGKQAKRKRYVYGVVAAILIGLAAIAIIIFKPIGTEPAKQIQATHRQITFAGDVSLPSISPDGKSVAYVTDRFGKEPKVFVQDITGGAPLEIFTVSDIFSLRWAQDGSELLISAKKDSSMGTYLVPRLGGTFRRMSFLPFVCSSPDGTCFAGCSWERKRIQFTDKSTNDTTSIALNGSFVFLKDIDWSPSGNLLLFSTTGQKDNTIWTITTSGTQQHEIVKDSVDLFSPRWSSSGDAIYYLRSGEQTEDLMKVKINPKSGQAEGVPIVIQSGNETGDVLSLSKDNKQLLYTRVQSYSNLWLVTHEGKGATKSIQTKQLTTGTSRVITPSMSPDGKKIVFSKGNLFVIPTEGGEIKQITFLDSYPYQPVWSPDGSEIAYLLAQKGTIKVWKISADGGIPHLFEKTEVSSDSPSLVWSPGSDILYHQPGNRNFHLLNPNTEEERPLVNNDSVGWMFWPTYSPDGKRVAVMWNRPPTPGLWVISLQDYSQRILHRGNFHPLSWSSNGETVYAVDDRENTSRILTIPTLGGDPSVFLDLPVGYGNRAVKLSPDGTKIVCLVFTTQSDAWLMENFDPEVK